MEAPRPALPNIARPKKLHRMSVTLDITAHFPSKDPQNTRKQSDMDRTYRKAIESVWPRLVRDLVLKPTFLQRLRTHGIFTQEVLNIIQNEPTPVLQKSLMLKLLMNRDSRQFHQFCQVLWDSGYHGLARALEDPQTDQREQAEALREEVTNLQQQNRLLTRRVRQLELDQQRTNKKLAEVTAELRSKDSRYTTQSSNEEDLLKKRNRTLRELLEMEEQYRRRMTKQRDGHV
ncbi:uncharacterized protein [Branchiostoma lanceolatum]|uniref:uncharacterized protein n=1 Tax=Branchiostoma lanceolatum TaxID=7740 RepID=UPI003452D16E